VATCKHPQTPARFMISSISTETNYTSKLTGKHDHLILNTKVDLIPQAHDVEYYTAKPPGHSVYLGNHGTFGRLLKANHILSRNL
jgi:hypothetical protein